MLFGDDYAANGGESSHTKQLLIAFLWRLHSFSPRNFALVVHLRIPASPSSHSVPSMVYFFQLLFRSSFFFEFCEIFFRLF